MLGCSRGSFCSAAIARAGWAGWWLPAPGAVAVVASEMLGDAAGPGPARSPPSRRGASAWVVLGQRLLRPVPVRSPSNHRWSWPDRTDFPAPPGQRTLPPGAPAGHRRRRRSTDDERHGHGHGKGRARRHRGLVGGASGPSCRWCSRCISRTPPRDAGVVAVAAAAWVVGALSSAPAGRAVTVACGSRATAGGAWVRSASSSPAWGLLGDARGQRDGTRDAHRQRHRERPRALGLPTGFLALVSGPCCSASRCCAAGASHGPLGGCPDGGMVPSGSASGCC